MGISAIDHANAGLRSEGGEGPSDKDCGSGIPRKNFFLLLISKSGSVKICALWNKVTL